MSWSFSLLDYRGFCVPNEVIRFFIWTEPGVYLHLDFKCLESSDNQYPGSKFVSIKQCWLWQLVVCSTSHDICLPWTNYSIKMPWRLRAHRVDQAALWLDCFFVYQLLDTSHHVLVHGRWALGPAADYECFDWDGWSSNGHRWVCCHHYIHMWESPRCICDSGANNLQALGGFKISFITDNIQGAMVIALSKFTRSHRLSLN